MANHREALRTPYATPFDRTDWYQESGCWYGRHGHVAARITNLWLREHVDPKAYVEASGPQNTREYRVFMPTLGAYWWPEPDQDWNEALEGPFVVV
jgi:hypothetical protein